MGTRINIVLDDDLIAEAMARAGVTTKKAAPGRADPAAA
jgi:Arc/MetJ family transcription regulator